MIASEPGVSSAPPIPSDQHLHVHRGGAQRGGHREPDRADHEHPAPAVPVAERAAQQDQPGQRERVGVHDPLQLGDRSVQLLADRREGDVDDGSVQERHSGAEHRRQQHPASFAGLQPDAGIHHVILPPRSGPAGRPSAWLLQVLLFVVKKNQGCGPERCQATSAARMNLSGEES